MNKLLAAVAAFTAALALPVAGADAQAVSGPPDRGISYTSVDEAWTTLHANARVTPFRNAQYSHWRIGRDLVTGAV